MCLLVLVGSTTTLVRHDHASGRRPHGHGFGLVTLLPQSEPESGYAAGTLHQHLVVLGVELYQPDPPPGRVPASPERPAHSPLVVELWAGSAEVTLADFLAQDEEPTDLPAWPGTGVFASPHTTDLAPRRRAADPVTRHALCDRARGERSGVLNV
ncbi:MAG: hypothetical protein JWO38_3629 [Gemmataceae bacterium]|nr:hypothetical protein [Gemmataceae bacterium]